MDIVLTVVTISFEIISDCTSKNQNKKIIHAHYSVFNWPNRRHGPPNVNHDCYLFSVTCNDDHLLNKLVNL